MLPVAESFVLPLDREKDQFAFLGVPIITYPPVSVRFPCSSGTQGHRGIVPR